VTHTATASAVFVMQDGIPLTTVKVLAKGHGKALDTIQQWRLEIPPVPVGNDNESVDL
jgi:hypothetical protein